MRISRVGIGIWAVAIVVILFVASCGGGSKSSSGTGGGGAAEAKSAATGDIPDNQVFLTYRNANAGYSIKYPEGWTRQGNAGDVRFEDKDNLVHVVVSP